MSFVLWNCPEGNAERQHWWLVHKLVQVMACCHKVGGGLGSFSKVVATFIHVGGSFNLSIPSQGCLNNPIFSNLGLCTACWACCMCHHKLWPTSVSHSFSCLNSSLGNIRKPDNYYPYPVRETYPRPLAIANTFWAGQVENWPGWVEFCIEHIRDICFRASAPEIYFPTLPSLDLQNFESRM